MFNLRNVSSEVLGYFWEAFNVGLIWTFCTQMLSIAHSEIKELNWINLIQKLIIIFPIVKEIHWLNNPEFIFQLIEGYFSKV